MAYHRGRGRSEFDFWTNFTTHSTFLGSNFAIVRVQTKKRSTLLRIWTSFNNHPLLLDTPSTIGHRRVTCLNHLALEKKVHKFSWKVLVWMAILVSLRRNTSTKAIITHWPLYSSHLANPPRFKKLVYWFFWQWVDISYCTYTTWWYNHLMSCSNMGVFSYHTLTIRCMSHWPICVS